MQPIFERTHILLKEQGLNIIQRSHVLIAGLGGVGSYTAEALARLGIGQLTIIDSDTVAESNINRQLVALHSTIGCKKVAVMKERILDINPACVVNAVDAFINEDTRKDILKDSNYSYVVDALDTCTPKVAFLKEAYDIGFSIVSSMGAGGKFDPTMIRVDDISKTQVCPLARKIRLSLRAKKVGAGIKAVYSIEKPQLPLPPEYIGKVRTRSVNGTVSYMPAIFGMHLAAVVTQDLLKTVLTKTNRC